ncbi:MAG: penicillin-binding protein 1C [Candidatus Aminicenantes bacterium]|nr:penicillin-binding protein 1C [Candidatus Aminicenantes bacterium]
MKRKTGLAVFVLAGLLFLTLFLPFPRNKLDPAPVVSLRLLDRNRLLLREVLSDEGGRCRWVGIDDVSPFLLKATIAAEDRHFFLHRGIDVFSMVRALWQNIRGGRVVSGASTITQQLVRNLHPGRRNLWTKAREAWLAVRLERRLSKSEILTQYINRISYGNQVYGIEAAARLYFDKPCSGLSLAESAFLAAIPRSPSLLNPYRAFPALKKKQAAVLDRMAALAFITEAEQERARTEELRIVPESRSFRAAHFCDFILAHISPEERRALSAVETTLDTGIQRKIETLLQQYLESMNDRGITNGAVVVLDNTRGEILSMVGSCDFFDFEHGGQVNGALAKRQPGSTLKPFTFGLALENGWTAASLIDDSPTQFSTLGGYYIPQNYDRRFHGMVSLRAALACSYNIPAVAVLQTIGPDLLYRRLQGLEFASLKEEPGYYGVGLTLGNGEVSLLELARAYSALARLGLHIREKSILRMVGKDTRDVRRPDEVPSRRVFSPEVAYIVTHILSDPDARIPAFGYHSPLAFPFPVAAKTGTSKDFRDNWAVGYTPGYTVGVWMGNFDGRPMHNVSGITGSGPLFRDIMLFLHRDNPSGEFVRPDGVTTALVCPLSGKIPTAFCPGAVQEVFIKGTEPNEVCSHHGPTPALNPASGGWTPDQDPSFFQISFPRNGDVFKIDPVLRQEHQRVRLKVDVSRTREIDQVEWWINGSRAGVAGSPFVFFWHLRPGSYTIKAVAVKDGARLESRSVKITVLA